MIKTFRIDSRMTVGKLKEEFKKKFGGCLHVKQNGILVADSSTLGSIGAKGGSTEFDVKTTSVRKFCEKAYSNHNLCVGVFTPDDWVEVIDPIKLVSLSDLPKQARTPNLYQWYLAEIKKSVNKKITAKSVKTKGEGLPIKYIPSFDEVEKWNKRWEMPRKMAHYMAQENILDKLFKQYPKNDKYEEVLLKVVVLNAFYSTYIQNTNNVAKRICKLAVDQKLGKSIDVVNKIARVRSKKDGSEINFFSFATKYCSFHCPSFYPIYDKFVCKVLTDLKKRDAFCEFTATDLRDAEKFKHVIDEFIKVYHLVDAKEKEVDYKTLDKYLWLLGKEYFK